MIPVPAPDKTDRFANALTVAWEAAATKHMPGVPLKTSLMIIQGNPAIRKEVMLFALKNFPQGITNAELYSKGWPRKAYQLPFDAWKGI